MVHVVCGEVYGIGLSSVRYCKFIKRRSIKHSNKFSDWNSKENFCVFSPRFENKFILWFICRMIFCGRSNNKSRLGSLESRKNLRDSLAYSNENSFLLELKNITSCGLACTMRDPHQFRFFMSFEYVSTINQPFKVFFIFFFCVE